MRKAEKEKLKKAAQFAAVLLLLAVLASGNASADPELNNTLDVEGGNVTYLDFDSGQQSQIWQGFFGQISGGLVLENSQGYTMYDWTIVEAKGEVLATRHIISDWSQINCSTQNEIYQEEYRLNIPNASSEGINDTYMNTTHPQFEVGLIVINGCRSTLTDNSTSDKAVFWNIVLNADANRTVFAGLIEDNVIGFNGTAVDYQLLVPANRTSGFAVYNFYLDLT